MTEKLVIGLDIGGGSTKLGLVSPGGTIVARRRLTYAKAATGDKILSDYASAIDDLMRGQKVERLAGIGIGYPGHILPDHISGDDSNVLALDGMPIAEILKRRFQCPVGLMNDADAGAIAEYRFGAGRGVDRLLMVTVGTGIGLAFLADGVPTNTANGCLGDAGHVIVVRDNPVRCRKGCLGCLESVASGQAIERHARRLRSDHKATSATAALVRDALGGNASALGIIAEAGNWIGMAAASWCNIFAPTTLLIGGGISAAGAVLVDAILLETKRRGMPSNVENVRFGIAELGNDAGIIGAAAQMF
ncbi:glucokinase [Mesorhizobium sp. 131-3-5]|uniref:ROK family protein n=1 Tax=Mesorhizobium sp. 131-3-5 TaxID=2744520 RepID=UPI0019297715|nr:ROK family protein [Mesorhizobium sp. 131-3-5]BCH08399.1 glucokinase [Mesorhizobium sp. 131-3-5]